VLAPSPAHWFQRPFTAERGGATGPARLYRRSRRVRRCISDGHRAVDPSADARTPVCGHWHPQAAALTNRSCSVGASVEHPAVAGRQVNRSRRAAGRDRPDRAGGDADRPDAHPAAAAGLVLLMTTACVFNAVHRKYAHIGLTVLILLLAAVVVYGRLVL